MNSFHISQAHQKIGLNGNIGFWIAMIKESQKILKPNVDKNILDFGCGDGKFLQVFDLMDSLHYGIGLELNKDLIESANKSNDNKNIKYETYNTQILEEYSKYFDAIYSQEVIYTIDDLKYHAKEMFNSLKCGGFYFATIGSHIDNPLWSKRRSIINKEEKYSAYDYSIEEIADIFYNTGFEVGIKRLPVEYFLIYHPIKTKDFSNSLLDLVDTSYDNKMLFSFYKPIRDDF